MVSLSSRYVFILLLGPLVSLAGIGHKARQDPQVLAWARSSSDSVRLRSTFIAIKDQEGRNIVSHSIYTPAELHDLDVDELVVLPGASVQVRFDPAPDSARVIPVRAGNRASADATGLRFSAPTQVGIHDYLVSATWRPDSTGGYAGSNYVSGGEWAVRLRIR